MLPISVTLPVTQSDIPSMAVRLLHSLNILLILVTDAVFQPVRLSEVSTVQLRKADTM